MYCEFCAVFLAKGDVSAKGFDWINNISLGNLSEYFILSTRSMVCKSNFCQPLGLIVPKVIEFIWLDSCYWNNTQIICKALSTQGTLLYAYLISNHYFSLTYHILLLYNRLWFFLFLSLNSKHKYERISLLINVAIRLG